jgi:Protein of unknown function (DUF433)
MDYTHLITVEPGKRGGQPCIRGMRIAVRDVLEYLAGGTGSARGVGHSGRPSGMGVRRDAWACSCIEGRGLPASGRDVGAAILVFRASNVPAGGPNTLAERRHSYELDRANYCGTQTQPFRAASGPA